MGMLFSFWTIGFSFGGIGVALLLLRLFAPVFFQIALAALKAFLSTRLGKTVALVAVVIVAGWIAATYFVGVGKNIVNRQIEKETVRNEQTREEEDARAEKIGDDALRRELDRWVRDPSRK